MQSGWRGVRMGWTDTREIPMNAKILTIMHNTIGVPEREGG